MSRDPAPPRPVLVLGEALVDRFADGTQTAGGAPFNVACWLALMQVPVRLVSRIGADDPPAALLRQTARQVGLDLSDMQVDPHRPTGVVDVHLDPEGPRYHLRAPAAWDHLDPAPTLASVAAAPPAVVVFGTLARRHADSARSLDAAVQAAARDGALCLADLNLRGTPDDRDERRRAEAVLAQADWVKVNDVELQTLRGWFSAGRSSVPPTHPDAPSLAIEGCALMARFGLQRLVVTCGAEGWFTLDSAGVIDARGPAAPVEAVADTVGAGDAFVATLAAGLCLRWPLALTLERASQVAALACSHRGALPKDEAVAASLKRFIG